MLLSLRATETWESPCLCSGRHQGVKVAADWLKGHQLENSAALISSSPSFAPPPPRLLVRCCAQQFLHSLKNLLVLWKNSAAAEICMLESEAAV